jgi:hypothetical protein
MFTSYYKCHSKMLLKRSKELYITGPRNPNKTGYRPPSLNLLSHAQRLRFVSGALNKHLAGKTLQQMLI